MALSTAGIVGTDGVTPVYDPSGRWTIWALAEVYTGGPGSNRYVPKVNDYVIDYDTYTTYIVISVDPTTLVPVMEIKLPNNMNLALSQTDVLFGVGPGTQADTYRVYLDKSVTPYILAVDQRLHVGGTMCKYAKIFRGSDLSGTGKVVSQVFDSSGNFVSENVPLELVAIDSHVNYSIKTVSVCYTNEDMPDGEVVTVVFYNDAGNVVSKRQLLVENTSFIRSVNASRKYISDISLESPFLSPTDNTLLEYPLNVPVNALNLYGIINYSDGSKTKMPVDGTKFRMLGVDQYVSTIVGQKLDLVLSYSLGLNESCYGAVTSDGKYVTEPYSLVTINPNNVYLVKLFGYPVWMGDAIGYQMKWFLFNLDRNVWFDVTGWVKFDPSTGPFDPKLIGVLQRKTVTLNLRDVSNTFKPYIHVQSVDIVLQNTPTENASSWTVSQETNSARPAYGQGIIAKRSRPYMNIITVDSGFADQATWLSNVYGNTYPLIDTAKETAPPVPTHFTVVVNGKDQYTAPISEWNQPLNVGVSLNEFDTVFLRFTRVVGSTSLQLSMAGIIVAY